MGFCLFNNIAIGARYAQQKYGVERIAVVDWDVHHGNGTQEIFYDRDSVLYVSLHQFPLWPGTGATSERGIGGGEGFTLNCPMKPGSGEQDYLNALEQEILPALGKFQPQLLMISAGFDAHRDDPLASIDLTEGSFSKMTELLGEASARYCGVLGSDSGEMPYVRSMCSFRSDPSTDATTAPSMKTWPASIKCLAFPHFIFI